MRPVRTRLTPHCETLGVRQSDRTSTRPNNFTPEPEVGVLKAEVGVLKSEVGVLKSEVTPLYTDTPHTALHHHTTLRSETATKNIPADILNKKDRFLGPVKCRRERERVSEIDLPLVTCAYSAPCGLVRREHFLTVWWYIIRL